MASPTRSSSLQTTTHVARIVTVVFVGSTYFVVIISALHVLRPDRNPLQQPTSEYAVGRYGWLMTSAFFSMSLASCALVLGLAQGLS